MLSKAGRVVGLLSAVFSLAAHAQGTPSLCSADPTFEGVSNMKVLFELERSYFSETDRYPYDLSVVGFAPAACADGSRAPLPGPGWVAGCRFVYRIASVTGAPDGGFVAEAQGATAEVTGVSLQINERRVFTLTRAGATRYVDWFECSPLRPACVSQECEGIQNVKAIFIAERSFLQEKDRYSSNLAEVGFAPYGCADGSVPSLPGPGWAPGCHFFYRVDLVGDRFTITARGASALTQGRTVFMDVNGNVTVTRSVSNDDCR
jgi:hypothetical protein